MIRGLKIKFVCINMLIVTVMLLVIFGLVLHITGRNMEDQGNRIIQSIHEEPLHKNEGLPEKRIPYFTAVITPQGTISVSTHTFFGRNEDQELLDIARAVYEDGEQQGMLREHSLRFSRRRTPDGEQIVFMDVSMQRGIFRDLFRTCMYISIVSYLLFFAVSVLLAQWAVRPVERAWNQQRQFVADASHELKTPLTVITTNAELLQDSSYEASCKAQFAQSILIMSRQMRGLVEGLLDLARVDNGMIKREFTQLDLSQLVSECILPFEVLFYEKGLDLDTALEENLILSGSESHLRQVMDILLDNAAKYADPEKKIQIQLCRQGKWGQFSIATAGAEISREDLKNIFKRFYRIDQARTMNQSYGLGLSIADSIVRQHKGRIWAESKNGINTFVVQLPLLQNQKKI